MGFPGVVTPISEAITLFVNGRKEHFSWLRVFCLHRMALKTLQEKKVGEDWAKI